MDSFARWHREHAHKCNDTTVLRSIRIVVRFCAFWDVETDKSATASEPLAELL